MAVLPNEADGEEPRGGRAPATSTLSPSNWAEAPLRFARDAEVRSCIASPAVRTRRTLSANTVPSILSWIQDAPRWETWEEAAVAGLES